MYQAAEMRLMSSIENVFKNLHGGAGHHNLHAVMLPDDYDFVIYLNALRDQLEMQEDRDPAASDEENGARPFPTIALEENQVPLVFNWIKELKAEHVNLSRMHKTGLKMKLEIVMDRINKAMELMTSLSNILGQSELAKEISSLFYKNDGPEAQVLRLDKPVKVNHELMKQSAQMQALSPFALFLAHPFPPLTAESKSVFYCLSCFFLQQLIVTSCFSFL